MHKIRTGGGSKFRFSLNDRGVKYTMEHTLPTFLTDLGGGTSI